MLGCKHARSHQDAGLEQFPLSLLSSCDRQVCTKLIPSLSFLQTSTPPTTSRPPILDLGPQLSPVYPLEDHTDTGKVPSFPLYRPSVNLAFPSSPYSPWSELLWREPW